MRSASPNVEELFAALCVLRDSREPLAQRCDPQWRVVDAWLAGLDPRGGADADEVRQQTLIAVARGVTNLTAEIPAQAAKWLSTVYRRKHIDALRSRRRDPIHRGLARTDDIAPIDAVPASGTDERWTPELVARIVEEVEEQVSAHLARTEPNLARRHHDRLKARVALARLVLGADVDELRSCVADDGAADLGRDRLYKWVERGRPIIVAALESWVESRPEAQDLVAELLEIVGARRSDAGAPRPGRRRDGTAP